MSDIDLAIERLLHECLVTEEPDSGLAKDIKLVCEELQRRTVPQESEQPQQVNKALVDNAKITARIHIEEKESLQSDLRDADGVIKQLRGQLWLARDALEFYATASYPDDGSGRTESAFQQQAKAALAAIGGGKS